MASRNISTTKINSKTGVPHIALLGSNSNNNVMTSKNTILQSNGGMNSMNTPINKKGDKNYF